MGILSYISGNFVPFNFGKEVASYQSPSYTETTMGTKTIENSTESTIHDDAKVKSPPHLESTAVSIRRQTMLDLAESRRILRRGLAAPRFFTYEDSKTDKPSEIIKNIWLGNFSHSVISNEYKFTKIFNIGVTLERQVADAKFYKIDDEENFRLSDFFNDICEEIHRQVTNKETVYVHC